MAMVLKIRKIKLLVAAVLLLPSSLCVVAAKPAATDPQAIGNITDVDTRENITRQEHMRLAEVAMRKGNECFGKKSYQDAVDQYLVAIKHLNECSESNEDVLDKIASCKKLIGKSYEYWSRDLYMEAKDSLRTQEINKAISLCEKASEIYPPSKAKNDALIEEYNKTKEGVEYRKAVNEETVIPNLEQRKYNIDILLRQGKALMKAEEFDKAKDKLEDILVLDPYQSEAIDLLYKINLKMYERAQQRANATHAERIAEGEWKGVSPVVPKTFGTTSESISTPIKKEIVEDKINKKLKNIIIDHIEFEEVTIPTVVKYLKMRSKQIDPEKEGVNIFLLKVDPTLNESTTPKDGMMMPGMGAGMNVQPRKPVNARAAANTEEVSDENAEEGEEGEEGETEDAGNMPTVTMVVDDISLGDAIRYICRAANLKYRVEKYAVVIAASDVPIDDVETRIYPIENEAIDSIGGGDTDAVRQHFESRGVNFPAGAKIVYDSRISRLIATNTPENLKKIEAIIHNELNAIDPQVLIQAKFVEVSQNDLDELGFNYTLSRNLQGANPWTGKTVDMGSRGRLEFDQNDALNRSITSNDTVFSFEHYANGYDFQAQVNAINQCDSLDILSTPRVTTMNGQEATIRMIREVYYPDDWSEAETATVNGTSSTSGTSSTIVAYTGSIPEFDEPTEEGIILRVTPNVDADRYTITMDMTPTIQRFVGWSDYSYTLRLPETSGSSTVYTDVTNTIIQPIIAQRSVETTVSIYDGETIVLGGIISDTVREINDNVPVLGKIPLVGRFFQSKGQEKTKKNLLIFLTCRLVNPDGTPIRERSPRGLPPFRQ